MRKESLPIERSRLGAFTRRAKAVLKEVFSNNKLKVGFIMLVVIALMGVVGRRMLPYDPLAAGIFMIDQPPNPKHILGTDSLGRDIFAQLLLGIENSLTIGFIVAIIGTVVGSTIGFVAGYYGGIVDAVLRSITDIFLVIPMLPLLILISSFVRVVDIWMMAMILSIFAWAWPARQIRAQVLSLKERDFVYMAKLSGMGSMEIIFIELMPHMFQWMGANFFNSVVWAILTEAGVEFLGLGPQNTMTLGMILYWAMYHAAVFRGMWWWWVPPIIMIVLIAVSLYLIHIGLDEIVNPRLRRL